MKQADGDKLSSSNDELQPPKQVTTINHYYLHPTKLELQKKFQRHTEYRNFLTNNDEYTDKNWFFY